MDLITPGQQNSLILNRILLRVFDGMHCGLLLVDKAKRVVALNRRAQDRVGEAILIKQGIPSASDRTCDASFQTILDQTLKYRGAQTEWRREAVALRREVGCPVIARIMLIEDAAVSHMGDASVAIVIVDPDECPTPSSRTLQQAFGMTPAEARLSNRLVCGERLQEIAKETSVAIGTLRSQLKTIFMKTQMRTQSQLVALLTRLSMFTEKDP